MSEVLDILLGAELRNVGRTPPEAVYRIRRLSREVGQPVEFRLRALSYDKASELATMGARMGVATVLAGVVEPNFRDAALAARLGLLGEGEQWGEHGVTPEDAVRALLLPGEIAEIAAAVERLSGYRKRMIEEVKKN